MRPDSTMFWCRVCSRFREFFLATDTMGKKYYLCCECNYKTDFEDGDEENEVAENNV